MVLINARTALSFARSPSSFYKRTHSAYPLLSFFAASFILRCRRCYTEIWRGAYPYGSFGSNNTSSDPVVPIMDYGDRRRCPKLRSLGLAAAALGLAVAAALGLAAAALGLAAATGDPKATTGARRPPLPLGLRRDRSTDKKSVALMVLLGACLFRGGEALLAGGTTNSRDFSSSISLLEPILHLTITTHRLLNLSRRGLLSVFRPQPRRCHNSAGTSDPGSLSLAFISSRTDTDSHTTLTSTTIATFGRRRRTT